MIQLDGVYFVRPLSVFRISGSRGNLCSSGSIEYKFFHIPSKAPGVFHANSSLRNQSRIKCLLRAWQLGASDLPTAVNKYSRMNSIVPKRVSRVQQSKAVDILHVAFSEVEAHGKPFSQKMDGIQCFCLGFCQGRKVWVPFLRPVACEAAARILRDDMSIFIEQQRSDAVSTISTET